MKNPFSLFCFTHTHTHTGAVVAREYGLPCVVGAVGATSILKFGDTVTLNAGKGFIVKVEEAVVQKDESS